MNYLLVSVAIVAVGLVLVWLLPEALAVAAYVGELRRQGLSNKEIGEVLRSQGRRMLEIAKAMRQGCGGPCHERYCELDPVGDQPHQCHVVGCSSIDPPSR